MKYVEKKESELGGETPSAEETYKIILRLDKSLKDPLTRLAKANGKSINRYIEGLISRAVYARK